MIKRHVVVVAAVLLIGGCASTAAPSSLGSATLPPSEPPIAAVGAAYIVSFIDDDRPFFDVVVDIAAPGTPTQTVASFKDVRPVGWDDAAPSNDMIAGVGATHLLSIVADRGERADGSDPFRTLLFDIRPGAGPGVEVAGALNPFWGPDGLLGSMGNVAEVVDPRSGAKVPIRAPAGVEALPYWLADGSGWAAVSSASDGTHTVGRLTAAGVFTAGPAQLYQATGRERVLSAKGGNLSYSISDGVTQSESALVEFRPDLGGSCECLVWVSSLQPGDDPGFGDGVWATDGKGLWVVFAAKDRRWLSHVVEPKVDAKVADLPPGSNWSIVGLSPDDRWIIVRSEESRSLITVDTVEGTATEIARGLRENQMPQFAGWVR